MPTRSLRSGLSCTWIYWWSLLCSLHTFWGHFFAWTGVAWRPRVCIAASENHIRTYLPQSTDTMYKQQYYVIAFLSCPLLFLDEWGDHSVWELIPIVLQNFSLSKSCHMETNNLVKKHEDRVAVTKCTKEPTKVCQLQECLCNPKQQWKKYFS